MPFCSWCLKRTAGRLVDSSTVSRNLYECTNCGRKIVECRACKNFARWDKIFETDDGNEQEVVSHHDQFCLEHRHEIPSFENQSLIIPSPAEYQQLFVYNAANLDKIATVSLVTISGAAIFAPAFFVAAPAIGGAIGSAAGLSGAAATSYGLAALGGGALAAGGLGMAGGLAVVTATGAAIGGGMGMLIGNSYMSDVKSFDIKKVRAGKYPAVITINGFLSEDDKKNEKGWQDWEDTILEHYPDRAWFHLYWESKNLSGLGKLISASSAGSALKTSLKKAALKASKQAAKKIGPAATVSTIMALSKNPWHVAMVKAEKAGILLATILQHTKGKSYVLMGNSLGCRVIYSALSTLSTIESEPTIEAVHLLGGAVCNNTEHWQQASKAVKGTIHNYHSSNDGVLKYLYSVGTFFSSSPIGRNPIEYVQQIENHDVSDLVSGHMQYKNNAKDCIHCNEHLNHD